MRRRRPWFLLLLGVAILSFAAWQIGWRLLGPRPPIRELIESPPMPESLQAIRTLVKEKRDYAAAEQQAREMLPKIEEEYGVGSLEAAWVRDFLVESLWRSGREREPEALELAQEAVRLKSVNLGEEHLEFAASLVNLASVYEGTLERERARPLYERVIEIREHALGAQHLDVARARLYLAIYLHNIQEYEKARDEYERVLGIQERADAETDLAFTLNNLAIVLNDLHEYKASLSYYQRALEIRERVHGKVHLRVAWTLNSLAELLFEIGEYSEAERHYRRALAVRKKLLPPGDDRILWIEENLANLYRETGRYHEAWPLYDEALTLFESHHGAVHVNVARIRNNLGWLYTLTGEYERARSYFEEALEIRKQVLGPNHPSVATTHDNLAALLVRVGDYAGAETHYRRAMTIVAESLGEDDPDYARSLRGLASVHVARKRYRIAEELLVRALEIQRAALDQDHPWVAQSLLKLGDLQQQMGQVVEAGESIREAISIIERSLGQDHPLVAEGQGDLALALERGGRHEDAFDAALRAEEISRSHLLLTIRTLPQHQALRYDKVRTSGLDLALSIAAAGAVRDSARRAWDALIGSRALILEEMAARRHSVARADLPEIRRLADEYEKAVRRLAGRVVRGPDLDRPDQYRSLHEAALAEKERAEKALAAKSSAFRELRARRDVGIADVGRHLPRDSALVAYARYNRLGLAGVPAGGVAEPHASQNAGIPAAPGEPVPSYMAFVLRAGEEDPSVVSLGSARKIELAVRRWADLMGKPVPPDSEDREATLSEGREAGEALRRMVWDRVAGKLDAVRLILVVPDGALNLVSIGALPVGESKYLIEDEPLVHYLSSERDVIPSRLETPSGFGLLALGGAGFDSDARVASVDVGKEEPEVAQLSRTEIRGKTGAEADTCPLLREMHFSELPEAVEEAREVAALWREAADGGSLATRNPAASPKSGGAIVHLSGEGATEAAFKAEAPGRRAIHIATHAFYLGESCPNLVISAPGAPRSRGVKVVRPARVSTRSFDGGGDPLLLAGFALAGANRRMAAEHGAEDGILTAAEIAAMDLEGVEWAVLSACDTAKGKIEAGEGVFGIRRAFEIAGAGAVIMSLWQVEDRFAREWMLELYESHLVGGLGTAEAVREASLRVLTRRREGGQSTHPYYWAAFVAAGSWR